jgi:hypothetical protein
MSEQKEKEEGGVQPMAQAASEEAAQQSVAESKEEHARQNPQEQRAQALEQRQQDVPYPLSKWLDWKLLLKNLATSKNKTDISKRQWLLSRTFDLATDVVCCCFADKEFDFAKENGVTTPKIRNVLVWGLDICLRECLRDVFAARSVGEFVDRELLVGDVFLLTLDVAIRSIAKKTWKRLCKRPQGLDGLTSWLDHVLQLDTASRGPDPHQEAGSQHEAFLGQVSRELEQLTDEQVKDVFDSKHKQLNILVQAAVVVLLFVRDDAHLHALQQQSVQAFTAEMFTDAIEQLFCKKGKQTPFRGSLPEEEWHLLHTWNFLQIAHTFIRGDDTKKLFMEITSRLAQNKSFVTGGGYTPFVHRREALYIHTTGTSICVLEWFSCFGKECMLYRKLPNVETRSAEAANSSRDDDDIDSSSRVCCRPHRWRGYLFVHCQSNRSECPKVQSYGRYPGPNLPDDAAHSARWQLQ